jgi:hypothetical protein
MQAMTHGDEAGRTVRDHLGDEERVEAWRTITLSEVDAFVLEGLQPTDATAPDSPDAFTVHFVQHQAAVLDGLIGAHHGELGVGVHLPRLLPVDEILGVEPLHLAGETRLELGGIEAVMGAAPLRPLTRPSQYSLRVFPRGVSAPRPVTTTRLSCIRSGNYFAFFST